MTKARYRRFDTEYWLDKALFWCCFF